MTHDSPHELTEVLNWRRVSARITTSGQPTENQLADLAAGGVSHVVNLGPHDNDGALEDEPGSVAALGMTYVYLPVDFEAPRDADFDAFCDTLAQLDGERIHVHCIYNARVSAFFYRHARECRGDATGETVDTAFARMDGIWRPGGVWARFIGDDSALDKPNRFKGYEY